MHANPRTTHRLRRALGGALILATALAGQAQAGPLFNENVSGWDGNSEATGNLRSGAYAPYGISDDFTIWGIRGTGVGFAAGTWAGKSFCNPFGPGTRLSDIAITYGRYHSTPKTGFLRVLSDGGEVWRGNDSDIAYAPNGLAGGWVRLGDSGGQCVTMQFYNSGASTGGNPLWVTQLNRVRVEDVQPASIQAFGVDPGWHTGATAGVGYISQDNDYRMGTAQLSVPDNGWSGDNGPARGDAGGTISIAGLADGAHRVVLTRTGSSGGVEASAEAAVYVDRNAPGAPGVNADGGVAAWSPRRVTVATSPTGDGTGSGWQVNYLYDGGGHIGNNSAVISEDGAHAVTARAQDVAGHVSGEGSTTVVRIDKSAPLARLGAASIVAPGVVDINNASTDSVSGIASIEARLGSASGPVVATSAEGLKNLGASAPARNSGLNKIVVTVTDRAGNTASTASDPVRFDSLAPSAQITSLPTGWVKGLAGSNRIGVRLADNLPDGLGKVQVQARQGAGGWTTISNYNADGTSTIGQGDHLLGATNNQGLGDGATQVRVVAHDPANEALTGISAEGTVNLDLTSPDTSQMKVTVGNATAPSVYPVVLAAGVTDPASGIAKVEILASRVTDDGDVAKMVGVGQVTNPGAGQIAVSANLSSLEGDGLHHTQLVITDNVGNQTSIPGPAITLDTAPPVFAQPIIDGSTGRIRFRIEDPNLGVCPVTIQINGPGTNGQWRTVLEQAAGLFTNGEVDFALPMDGLASGAYQVRTSVCDIAGNTASRTGSFTWVNTTPQTSPGATINGTGPNSGAGNGATASRPDLTDALIGPAITPQASSYRVIHGQRVPVIKAHYGKPYLITGRVADRGDTGIKGIRVELRDPAGKHVAGAVTDKTGRYTIRTRALRGGLHQVVAIGTPERRALVALQVTPRVTAKITMRSTASGARTLKVTGKLMPMAGSRGKRVQLQWRDGNRWRPISDTMVNAKGKFTMSYAFRKTGGYKLQVRVMVPTEKGWPFLSATTKNVKVHVGR